MCIICIKPAGIDFPSRDVLSQCFLSNPDGAGFMYPDNGKVNIEKGFMSFDDFFNNLLDYSKGIEKRPFILHFRIGTHGGKTDPALSHPFPVTRQYDHMMKLSSISDTAIAHNGILNGMPVYTQYSDTMVYTKSVIRHALKLDKKDRDELINATLEGCRLAIMDGKGHIDKYGSWQTFNGCFYSNGSYIKPKYSYFDNKYSNKKGRASAFYNTKGYSEDWTNEDWSNYEDWEEYDPITDKELSSCADPSEAELIALDREIELLMEDKTL